MKAIKEFKFDRMSDALAIVFIQEHNKLLHDLRELKKLRMSTKIKSCLKSFLSNFSTLPEDPKEVTKTIICAPRNSFGIIKSVLGDKSVLDITITAKQVRNLSTIKQVRAYLKTKKISVGTKSKPIPFKHVLLGVFDYSGRRKFLLDYYKELEMMVCIYCLAQQTSTYTSSTNNKVYLTGNLDHIDPKDSYPFLAISINNLVPVCAHCNQRKSSTSYHYSPFNESHNHNFDFSDCLEIDSNANVSLTSLDKLKVVTEDLNAAEFSRKLNFADLYQNFDASAEILIERFKKFNSEGYKESINEIVKVHDPDVTVEQFISEIPLHADNVLKFPLTKFKMDLYNALKELKTVSKSK